MVYPYNQHIRNMHTYCTLSRNNSIRRIIKQYKLKTKQNAAKQIEEKQNEVYKILANSPEDIIKDTSFLLKNISIPFGLGLCVGLGLGGRIYNTY